MFFILILTFITVIVKNCKYGYMRWFRLFVHVDLHWEKIKTCLGWNDGVEQKNWNELTWTRFGQRCRFKNNSFIINKVDYYSFICIFNMFNFLGGATTKTKHVTGWWWDDIFLLYVISRVCIWWRESSFIPRVGPF